MTEGEELIRQALSGLGYISGGSGRTPPDGGAERAVLFRSLVGNTKLMTPNHSIDFPETQ